MPDTTENLSRRAILSAAPSVAAAAAVGVGALAVPVLAGEELHSPIRAAYAEYRRLELLWGAADTAVDKAYDRYEEPEKPPYRITYSIGDSSTVPVGPNRNRPVLSMSDENIAELKKIIAEPVPVYDGEESSWHAFRHERAKEALAQIEAWKEEDGRRREVSGVAAAEKALDAVKTSAEKQRGVILAMHADNLHDLVCQAAACVDDNSMWKVVERMIEVAGIQV